MEDVHDLPLRAAPVEGYAEIFAKRGAAYHEAMSAFPHARDHEFLEAIAWADLRDGQVVCDAPSGPGDLARYVTARVSLVHVEPSADFARRCRARGARDVLSSSLEELPLGRGSVDRVISLAALHHVLDKPAFFREAQRVLKREGEGVLCIADACRGSVVAEFLNGFVHAHNSMGHRGVFIDPATADDLEEAGFVVERAAVVACPWRFRSRDEMAWFAKRLFGLDRATPAQTLAGIERHLGCRTQAGEHHLDWELLFIRAVNR
ncbi:MAG: class I SAM-dependent methyltransferase [Candidatus Binatia bacterium]